MYPQVANCALGVKYRHLNFLTGPLVVVLALADDKLIAAEKEGLGKKLADQANYWDANVEIRPVEFPHLQEDRFWQVYKCRILYSVMLTLRMPTGTSRHQNFRSL